LDLFRARPLPVRLLWAFGAVVLTVIVAAPITTATRQLVLAAFIFLQLLGLGLSLRSALNRRLEPRLRRAWLAMALALVALLVSGFSFGAASALDDQGLDSESMSAIGYLARVFFAPAALFAIFSFPGPVTRRHDWLMHGLDLLMVLGCGAMACWYFIAGPALETGGVELVALVGVAAPVANLALVSGAVLVMMRGVSRAHRRRNPSA
jgi:drug/metabolite transporter (DMT)-like permease